MATWNKAKARWQASLGTGESRKWFYSKTPGEPGRKEVERLKSEYLNGPAPCRPGSVNEFFERVWWPQMELDNAKSTNREYLRCYTVDIEPKFGNLLLIEINALMLQTWVNELRSRGLSPKTINNKFGVLSSLLSEAHRLGAMKQSFKDKIKLPEVRKRTERRDLDFDLADKVLAALSGTIYEGPAWAMLTMGLRQNEVLGLRPCDIVIRKDSAIITLSVNRQKLETKEKLKNHQAGESRSFAVPREWGLRLLEHQYDPNPEGFLFRNSYGQPINPSTFGNTISEKLKKAGLTIVAKEFRHVAISNMRRIGIDGFLIADIVGHGNVDMSRVYMDRSHSDSLKAFSRLKDTYDSRTGKNDS
jgi:integrase